MPTQQFFSYTMARWNDDEVRFVLDQHAKLDFYRLANWNLVEEVKKEFKKRKEWESK
jgi:hypothetical protein